VKFIAKLPLLGCTVFACAAFACVPFTTAAAEIYRWVDRDGKPHYGDGAAKRPGEKAEQLTIQPTHSAIDPEAEKARQQLRELDQVRQQQQQTQAEQAAQSQQQREQLQQRCKALQDEIRTEHEVAVLFRYDDSGNRVLWTSDERIAYREQLQDAQQQHCSE
jgi:uncharacterized FlaG/YvyC family protein